MVDARDLDEIEHPVGNDRCEWGQIRRNRTAHSVRGCNPELSLRSALASIHRGECVAIGTQQSQVFKPVVLVVPVDVIEL